MERQHVLHATSLAADRRHALIVQFFSGETAKGRCAYQTLVGGELLALLLEHTTRSHVWREVYASVDSPAPW